MACEISSCDEILLTEMVFQNVFEGMTTDHIVAMCSCLVFDEKVKDGEDGDGAGGVGAANGALLKSFEKTKDIASNIARVMQESKVPINVEDYVAKLKPHMMTVVLQWLEQKPFKDIMAVSEE